MQAGLSAAYAAAGRPGANETASSPRLVKAAHEFEGQMMKELLKPLTSDDLLTGSSDDSDASGGSGGALGEFASESLGQALSLRGGFGIADGIIHSISRAGNHHQPPSVTQNPPANTVMKAGKSLTS
jgi:Rod binding domain-containing protein